MATTPSRLVWGALDDPARETTLPMKIMTHTHKQGVGFNRWSEDSELVVLGLGRSLASLSNNNQFLLSTQVPLFGEESMVDLHTDLGLSGGGSSSLTSLESEETVMDQHVRRKRSFLNPKSTMESDAGILLQLGLSSNSELSEHLLCYHNNNNNNNNRQDDIPIVDEGSTSARSVKLAGGYMPSLLMCSTPKLCSAEGCLKGARGASGLCIAHGGGRRCQKQGCSKGAEGCTVYCKKHGGGRRCESLGCTKSAEGKTDYCISHGGGRRCSYENGCNKAARGRSGLCIRHGGGKRCQSDGCTKSAEGHLGLCISHGGGRRCQYVGCTKGAQGSTSLCKAHGGGKRCMIHGCDKGAEGSTPLCKGHGGGKRCLFEGGGVCAKSVHGGTLYCVAHGGGKRCASQGCTKSARGKTAYCVRHGGGRRCKHESGCDKSAQGSTDFCKAHGGGKRCAWGRQHDSTIMEKLGGGDDIHSACDKFARGKTGLCAAHLAQSRTVLHSRATNHTLKPGLFRGLVQMPEQSADWQQNTDTGATRMVTFPPPTVIFGSDMSNSGINSVDSQQPLIPSNVLVPVDMQRVSVSEERVHGGGLMSLLHGESTGRVVE